MSEESFEEKLSSLGAFEISNKMIELAEKNHLNKIFLNAGRGNPNWINAKARKAYARFMEFAIEESSKTIHEGDLAGYILGDSIEENFEAYFNQEDEISVFIRQAVQYCTDCLHLNKKEILLELCNGIIGNNYPVPSRCLTNIEPILNAYLQSTLYPDTDLAKTTKLFPVEGGTGAIVYIFKALKHNGLLGSGDKIAINTPIFTPYIQIPELSDFKMTEIQVNATESDDWDIPKEEIEKLLDPTIKAFFAVNPTNPGSHAFSKETLNRIKEVVEKRKDLIIITDDVYGTFVDGFKSLYGVLPYNTLLVYSFSKLYGCTGWRLGLIAANENNVFDELLKKLDQSDVERLHGDYSFVVNNPEALSFVDRIVADSRDIGLYHTSGLSTPQQVMMAFFALSHLVSGEKDTYIETAKKIVGDRYHILYEALGIKEDNSKLNAKYYTLIDLYELAKEKYGQAFSEYLKNNYNQIDFLLHMSEDEGTVLMEGLGFDAPTGTLRVSQANLPDEDYRKIGHRFNELLEKYYEEYKKGSRV